MTEHLLLERTSGSTLRRSLRTLVIGGVVLAAPLAAALPASADAVPPPASAQSTVSLSLTSPVVLYGDPSVLKIAVAARLNAATTSPPSGTVTVQDNAAVWHYDLGVFPADHRSLVELDLSGTAPGLHTFTVSYPGNYYYLPSSSSIRLFIAPVCTSTTVTLPVAATTGSPVTVGVTVRSDSPFRGRRAPIGTIEVSVDGHPAGATEVTGGGTVTIGALAAGKHRIVARYTGGVDGGWLPSTSSTATLTVGAP